MNIVVLIKSIPDPSGDAELGDDFLVKRDGEGSLDPGDEYAVEAAFLQILLGALNVWLGENPALIVAHLALATVLWATVVHAATSLLPVPAGARRNLAGSRATETQAATA